MNFFKPVVKNVPQVTFHAAVRFHQADLLHIASHLIAVFVVWTAEFEVYHSNFIFAEHDPVGAVSAVFSCIFVIFLCQDRALIVKLHRAVEPTGHFGQGKCFFHLLLE